MINKDNIDALKKFGGLLVYEVRWFDTVACRDTVECRTFNEEYAILKLNSLLRSGFTAYMFNYFVHFNEVGE
jgi:hypothetical protein